MGELDKWTATEFNKVEKDLLEKKKRRAEIPQKISEKEKDISSCRSQNVELERRKKQLEDEERQKEYALGQQRNNLRRSYAAGPMDEQMEQSLKQARFQMEREIANTETRLANVRSEMNRCLAEIRKNYEKIRVQEATIRDLEEEDKRICKECEEHVKTFQNIAVEAEKATQIHKGAGDKFAQSGLSRFGKEAIQKGQNTANENAKKFRDKELSAQRLSRLALLIIQGGDIDTPLSSGGGSGATSFGVSNGRVHNQYQDIMNIGYESTLTPLQESGHREGKILLNSDGTTDFSTISICGAVDYDQTTMMSSDYLDELYGETINLSRYDVKKIREDSGLVWRIEGNKLYMISQEHEKYGSIKGYTIPEDTHYTHSRKKG